jgi:RimJ/RimL family protein N-acetyltransferase
MNHITLRDWENEDITLIPKLADNRKIWDNLRDEFPHPFLESDAINFIKKVREDSAIFSKAIEFNTSLAGCITLNINDDILRFSGLLGYWIGQKYWNQGIATSAVDHFTELVFEQLRIVRVYAKVFATNHNSIRVLEKCGYVKEGDFSKAVYKNGRFFDQVLYAKTCS